MTKCDITNCGKEMTVMHPTEARKDGALFQNLDSGRAYFICNGCIEKLGLRDMRKK